MESDRKWNWVGTGGGPLIVVPVDVAHDWRGDVVAWRPDQSYPELLDSVMANSDYGRACCIPDELGSLSIGSGRGLVLHGENLPTAFVPTREGGMLIRWDYAETEECVVQAVPSVPESLWETTEHTLTVIAGRLLIFDSAYPGDALPDTCGDGANVPYLEVALRRGNYEVDTAVYERGDSIRLVLSRLRRRRSAGKPATRDPR